MTGGLSVWQLLFGYGGNPLLIAVIPLYLFAGIKGDKTDRASAHVLASGAVLYVLMAHDQPNARPSWPYSADQLGIHALLLTAQTVIALRSSRRYPIIMAATQLLIVMAGVLGAAGLIAHEKTFFVIAGGASVIQLGGFIVGLTAHCKWRRNAAPATVFAG